MGKRGKGGSIIEPPPPTGWTVTTAVASFYGISSVIPYSSTTKIYSWCCHLTVFVFTASGSQYLSKLRDNLFYADFT